MAATLVEKIIRRASDAPEACPGDHVRIRPDALLTHDNSAAVITKFEGLFPPGVDPEVADAGVCLIALDHDVQNHSPENLAKYARIERFASRHGIEFHRAGAGIGHQLMLERDRVRPGALCVASDSHANIYGALGALGAPVVRTDAAAIWATGGTWWRVPRTVRVELTGELPADATAKDVIVTLCGRFHREALNAAVEFGGPGLQTLDVAGRMTIANMTTEWGAVACAMEPDDRVAAWLRGRGARPRADDALAPDEGASYATTIELDLSTVTPCVTGPNTVSAARPVYELAAERIRIDKAYLLSCVNARPEDLRVAARVARGRRVAPHVELYVAAASASAEAVARETGDWHTLLDAGAIPLPPGCGPCIGLGAGTVEPGEVAISATNRNYPGRMGSREASVYLASPAVVVASAIEGFITGPGETPSRRLAAKVMHHDDTNARSADALSAPAPGGAGVIAGRAVRIPEADVSTDQIFAGRWTYREGLTPSDMASVVFENLDSTLASALRPGDILMAGENFGTGSSREQAATALLAAGVHAVICVSVSGTYLRNAINNGLLCLECPAIAPHLGRMREQRGRVGGDVRLDLAAGSVRIDEEVFSISPPSEFVRGIIDAGGLEPMVRTRLARDLAESNA